MSDAGYRMLGAGAWGWSREMIWGGRWEGCSCLGTHVHPWQIHVNVWQNQYSIVKKNKVKTKFFLKKERKWTERKWKWSRSVMSDSFVTPRTIAPPGSSIHGTFQARILEWVAISFSRRSPQPRDWTWVSRIVGRHLIVWATREAKLSVILLNKWSSWFH